MLQLTKEPVGSVTEELPTLNVTGWVDGAFSAKSEAAGQAKDARIRVNLQTTAKVRGIEA